MFSSKSNNDTPKAEYKAQSRKTSGIPSVLSSDLPILGNLISDGAVDIDGYVEGNVQCASASIHKNGRVKGDVVAESIQIYGKVEGLIKARSVQLFKGCHVEGVIMHESITIEDGAFVDGRFKRTDRVLEDTTPKEEIFSKLAKKEVKDEVKPEHTPSLTKPEADDAEAIKEEAAAPVRLESGEKADLPTPPATPPLSDEDDEITPDEVPEARGASLKFEMVSDDEKEQELEEAEKAASGKRPRRIRMLDNLRLISENNN